MCYAVDRRMNFIKSVARKKLPEYLPLVINVFLNTGKEIRVWEGEVCDGKCCR